MLYLYREMELLSDKRLIATLSAFSLLTIGAGIATRILKGNSPAPGDREGPEIQQQEAVITQELSKLEGRQGMLARRAE